MVTSRGTNQKITLNKHKIWKKKQRIIWVFQVIFATFTPPKDVVFLLVAGGIWWRQLSVPGGSRMPTSSCSTNWRFGKLTSWGHGTRWNTHYLQGFIHPSGAGFLNHQREFFTTLHPAAFSSQKRKCPKTLQLGLFLYASASGHHSSHWKVGGSKPPDSQKLWKVLGIFLREL